MNEEIKSGMIALYEDSMTVAKHFSKKNYDQDVTYLKEKYKDVLQLIKAECDDSDADLEDLIACVPEKVAKDMEAVTSKRKREMKLLDYNLAMVSFFVPLIGDIRSEQAPELASAIVERWNTTFPETKIGMSTLAAIEGGFKKGLCYVTTAVCKSLNRPDNCHELTLLRRYRDEYLLGTMSGNDIIRQYYNIAPTIVKRINRSPDAAAVYEKIWKEYLSPCVDMIEKNQMDGCKDLYTDMVHELEQKYLYS